MRSKQSLFLTFIACVCVGSLGSLAWSCARPHPNGMTVRVVGEQALIVWDAANQTEHFIRGAVFDTTFSDSATLNSNANDFGFLVPTPTTPDLAEANPQLFHTLYNITAAKEVRRKQREAAWPRSIWASFSEIFFGNRSRSNVPTTGAVPESAQVLKQQQVAGYDAVVLSAEKPELILKWLQKNGYEANENLTEWLRWYTDHQWVITAFKISAGDDSQGTNRRASNQLVRISFRTERPFYPYREPKEPENLNDTPQPTELQRTLRVWFVSDQAGNGTLGNEPDAPNWTARTEWRDAIKPSQLPLLKDLSQEDRPLAEKLWLTEFLDSSSPRQGTDEVYFAASPNAGVIHRPDKVYVDRELFYPWTAVIFRVALDLLPLVGLWLASAGVWRWRMRGNDLPANKISPS